MFQELLEAVEPESKAKPKDLAKTISEGTKEKTL